MERLIKDEKMRKVLDELLASARAAEKRRAEMMSDEKAALEVMFEAYQRLKELGFRPAMYCPKDGSQFEAIEAGCTGIQTAVYDGKWPDGRYWALEAHDMWPSNPILFRAKKSD